MSLFNVKKFIVCGRPSYIHYLVTTSKYVIINTLFLFIISSSLYVCAHNVIVQYNYEYYTIYSSNRNSGHSQHC